MELPASTQKAMTLKELTDLINVRHDKAMVKVEKLATEPSFGTVSKVDIVYNNKGQTTPTYLLDERQSIAVASRLNDSLLMRVIDRWRELEAKEQPIAIPQTYAEALQLAADQAKQLEEARPKLEYHDKVLATENGITTTEIASELGMTANKLNKLLEAMKIQRKIGRRWVLTAANIGKGYDVEITHVDDGGVSRHAMKWSEKGRKFIHELIGQ